MHSAQFIPRSGAGHVTFSDRPFRSGKLKKTLCALGVFAVQKKAADVARYLGIGRANVLRSIKRGRRILIKQRRFNKFAGLATNPTHGYFMASPSTG